MDVELLGVGKEAPSALTTVTDRGYIVEVDRAHLGVTSVVLQTCSDRFIPPGAIADLLIPSAHAHGIESNSTVLASPLAFNAFWPTADFGAFTPPAGDYCDLTINVGPMPQTSRGDAAAMTDCSLIVAGRYRRDNTNWKRFEVISRSKTDAKLGLKLELGDDTQNEKLQVRLHPEAWFEGIEFDDPDLDRALLANAATSLEVVK